jgi:glucokinase
MYLGIEIGGTKLQLAVGAGDGSEPLAFERRQVDSQRGAAGILEQIAQTGRTLVERHAVARIGIGFGGPVDTRRGRVTTSHQIAGWDDFPLVEWCEKTFGIPARLGNDCDAAALAEARFGAGRGRRCVFYVTVGTGIGGGLVWDGRPFGAGRPAIAEIGHLRPGLEAGDPHHTVESLASGWGIAAACRKRLVELVPAKLGTDNPVRREQPTDLNSPAAADIADLRTRCGDHLDQLTTQMIADAAATGNRVALHVLHDATRTLGWAIAQAITLVAPEVVVVGGGVSLIGARLFFEPLRAAVRRYVFPPLADCYEILPAELGEQVVVHGALALAGEV